MKTYFCVGISSPSGGGKSTVAARVAELLGNASIVAFDDYDDVSTHPENYQDWLKAGADYNAWQTPQLAADLQHLKAGVAVIGQAQQLSPTDFIVFDAPLGRAHQETGKYIDLMVFLATPLDVAMARRILRDYYSVATLQQPDACERLRVELESYLNFGRQAYLEMDKQIKPLSDIILDGTRPVDELAMLIAEITRPKLSDKV